MVNLTNGIITRFAITFIPIPSQIASTPKILTFFKVIEYYSVQITSHVRHQQFPDTVSHINRVFPKVDHSANVAKVVVAGCRVFQFRNTFN